MNKHLDGTPIRVGQKWKHADGSIFTIFGEDDITYACKFHEKTYGNADYDLCQLAYIDNCTLLEDVEPETLDYYREWSLDKWILLKKSLEARIEELEKAQETE